MIYPIFRATWCLYDFYGINHQIHGQMSWPLAPRSPGSLVQGSGAVAIFTASGQMSDFYLRYKDTRVCLKMVSGVSFPYFSYQHSDLGDVFGIPWYSPFSHGCPVVIRGIRLRGIIVPCLGWPVLWKLALPTSGPAEKSARFGSRFQLVGGLEHFLFVHNWYDIYIYMLTCYIYILYQFQDGLTILNSLLSWLKPLKSLR